MKTLSTLALILLCLSAKSQSFSDYESYCKQNMESYCLKQRMDSIDAAHKFKRNFHYGVTHPLYKTKISPDIIEKKSDVPKKNKKVGFGKPENSLYYCIPKTRPHTFPLFYFNF